MGTVSEDDSVNILLEFVPGGSISSLLGKFGAFPEAVSYSIFYFDHSSVVSNPLYQLYVGYKNIYQTVITGTGILAQEWYHAQGH